MIRGGQISVLYPGPSGWEGVRAARGRRQPLGFTAEPAVDSNGEPYLPPTATTKLAGTAVVLLWPRRSLTVKTLSLPPAQSSRLAGLLHYELEGRLPIPAAEAYLSAYRGNSPASGDSSQHVVAFCAKAAELDAAAAALQNAGVSVSMALPSTVALLHSLPERDGLWIHVECRRGDTEMLLLQNGKLMQSGWAPERDVTELAAQIRLWWKGIQHESAAADARVSLRGEQAAVIAEQLRSHFAGVEVLPGAENAASAYLPMLAAALKADTWQEAGEAELTPPQIKAEGRQRRRQQRSMMAGLVAAGLVGFLGAYGYWSIVKLERMEKRLQAEWQAIAEQAEAAVALRTQRDRLLKEAQAWRQVVADRLDWPTVLNELAAAVPEGVWLTDIRVEKGKPFQLSGNAASQEHATAFIKRLEKTATWSNARLDLSKVAKDAQGVTSFIIGGNLK